MGGGGRGGAAAGVVAWMVARMELGLNRVCGTTAERSIMHTQLG